MEIGEMCRECNPNLVENSLRTYLQCESVMLS